MTQSRAEEKSRERRGAPGPRERSGEERGEGPPRPDYEPLRREFEQQISGEVRFDTISRALYSTDASAYQIEPAGVVVPRTRDDLIRIARLCADRRVPLTLRGGGRRRADRRSGTASSPTRRNISTKSSS